jgi:uncharacterized protein (TIRG00374 family)
MHDGRRKARTLLAWAVGGAFLVGMLAYVGFGRIAHALASASPLPLALAVAAYAAFFLLRGWRWRTLLSRSARDVRSSSTVAITAVGWLANSIVPLKGGDVLRAALLAKREAVGGGAAAATVTLERVLDMLGLALVAALGLLLLPDEHLPRAFARALEVAWLAPLVGLAALLLLVLFRERALRWSERLLAARGRWGAKLHAFLATTVDALAVLLRQPRLLAVVIPQSVVVTIAQSLVFTFLVRAFLPGTPMIVAFGGSAVFLLSFAVSVTPGNVGTYEAAFAAVFATLTGTAWDAAVAAGILTHVMTTLIVSVLGGAGMVFLGASGTKPTLHSMPAPSTRAAPAGGGRV